MNIYFLVEGNTEKKVYPAWLQHLLPQLQRVKNYYDVDNNNYFIFNGKGQDQIIHKHFPNAIADIQENGKYNYLVFCLDAEDVTISYKKQEIYDVIRKREINLGSIQLIIIVQNRCLETWFLGNRRMYTKNPQDITLLEYTRYYDVSEDCPELMGNYQNFNTHAQFHKAYLKELFKAKNISYSETRPGDVLEDYYLEQLITRTKEETEHLPTFQAFIQFCNMIKPKLSS